MNRGVLQVARHFVKGDRLQEGMLNRVEAVDPLLRPVPELLDPRPGRDGRCEIQLVAPDGTRPRRAAAVTAGRRSSSATATRCEAMTGWAGMRRAARDRRALWRGRHPPAAAAHAGARARCQPSRVRGLRRRRRRRGRPPVGHGRRMRRLGDPRVDASPRAGVPAGSRARALRTGTERGGRERRHRVGGSQGPADAWNSSAGCQR